MTNIIGQSIQHYHILEQLGEGGMAIVYKAYDTRLERAVAVKVIRAQRELSAEVLKRFAREARALARLSHPNIVKVLDYGEYEGLPFLVMEYLPGGTLKERMDKAPGRPVNWQAAARLLVPIAAALEAAHKENIIHRDVKPSNILIGANNQPMLTDFGIAKILDGEETTELTATGVGIGTPRYMAPEQGMGRADERADIYALGTIFYELVTGKPPYQGDTPLAILLKKNSDPLPRPKSLVPNLPDSVEAILVKALARLPENRYQSMSAFRLALEKPDVSPPPTDLDATIDDEKLSARLAPLSEKRSHRWVSGLGGILTLVLLGCLALGGLTLFGVWATQAYANRQVTPSVAFVETAPVVENLPQLTSETPFVILATPTEPEPIRTEMPIATPTESAIISADGATWVFIPAGEFLMGSNPDPDPQKFWGAEAPQHPVYLKEYWIYQTEVTNVMYRACVDAQACPQPLKLSSRTRPDYFTNPLYDDYPVIYVTQPAASTYCRWIGGRLPTEAEWEKAARGTDGRLYPWGNHEIQNNLANFCDVGCPHSLVHLVESDFDDGYRDTAPVGSFPAGVSPYGLLDMAGNVLEWVSDWHDSSYYAVSPYENPRGPNTGTKHPFRGGSWFTGRAGLRAAARASGGIDYATDTIGFRCAADSPP
jgi:eukaryotic-like serine/threonine-protein kinase